MIRRLYRTSCLFCMIGFMIGSPAGAEESLSSTSGHRLLAIIDIVLAKHIDPPVRQQLVLTGVKALDQKHQQHAEEISRLSTHLELVEYLDNLLNQFDDALRQKKEEAFLHAMLESLPGGASISKAKDARVEEQLAANRYVGIGVQATLVGKATVFQNVISGGTAEKAGILPQDELLEIDGRPTSGKELGQIVDELRGAEGTSVTLLVKQPSSEPRSIVVRRSVTFIPTIQGAKKQSSSKWDYIVNKAPTIAYIQILKVGPSTIHEIKKVEAELRDRKIGGLILDLRSVSGRVHDVVMLADQFLEEGAIAHVQSREGQEIHQASPGSIFRDAKLAVLVSESSGAAASLFAAALQGNKRATTFGFTNPNTTFVKSGVDLPTGDKLLLATAVLQGPNGVRLLGTRVTSEAELEHKHNNENFDDKISRSGFEPSPFGDNSLTVAVKYLVNQITEKHVGSPE